MKRILGCAAVVLVGAAVVLACVWVIRGPRSSMPMCELCQRPVHHATAFSLEMNGKKLWVCCPRCWLDYERTAHGKVANPTATDYVSGKMMPAKECVYVEGSDLAPCCSTEGLVGNEKVPTPMCFDRCYPSVIAFTSAGDAEKFTKEHGGAVLSFEAFVKEARGK